MIIREKFFLFLTERVCCDLSKSEQNTFMFSRDIGI